MWLNNKHTHTLYLQHKDYFPLYIVIFLPQLSPFRQNNSRRIFVWDKRRGNSRIVRKFPEIIFYKLENFRCWNNSLNFCKNTLLRYNFDLVFQVIWWQVIKKIAFRSYLKYTYHLKLGLHRFWQECILYFKCYNYCNTLETHCTVRCNADILQRE